MKFIEFQSNQPQSFIFPLAFVVLLAGCGHGINSGTGKKIGQVIQLGQHGMICKTYEGKLVRGGFNTGSGVAGGVFEFTVDSPELFTLLNIAMEKQQEASILLITEPGMQSKLWRV